MSQIPIPIAIGIGGFIGAVLRFYISEGVVRFAGEDYRFVGTMLVNLLGCFAIGVAMATAARSVHLSPVMQKCLITGLLGALTTFSTFAFEAVTLINDGRLIAAFIKLSCSLLFGLLLVWAGMSAASRLISHNGQVG